MASEDFATEGQIKRLYAVLHSVGLDPTQWKKDQNIASYAKLTRAQCSGYIDEVEALEAEQKADKNNSQLPRKPDEKEQFGARAQAEAQRISEEQGRATIPEAAVKSTPATDSEKVDYYVNLIGEITEKVKAEERILEKEQGYAINMVFNAITRDTRTALIAELKNGGDQ